MALAHPGWSRKKGRNGKMVMVVELGDRLCCLLCRVHETDDKEAGTEADCTCSWTEGSRTRRPNLWVASSMGYGMFYQQLHIVFWYSACKNVIDSLVISRLCIMHFNQPSEWWNRYWCWKANVKEAVPLLFCQDSGGGWRNDKARLLIWVMALCFIGRFNVAGWAMGGTL